MNGNALRRYSRHLLIPEVGLAGQQRLAASRVLVVGAGGLGCPVLQYLAAAGVGRIGIVDGDTVDETNLQRQTIYTTADIGANKARAATAALAARNPTIALDTIPQFLDAGNARALVRLYDVVVDCTDRFSVRYLLSDACVLEGKPEVYGSIFRFDGQVSVFAPGGPCYRCLFPEPPPAHAVPSCADGGVLGALAGIVGAWQASEALKLVLGIGEPLIGRLLLIDARDARVREVRFERDPGCAVCGDAPAIVDVIPEPLDPPEDGREIEPEDLDVALQSARLIDLREPHEAVLDTIPGALRIPAGELPARLHELDSATDYVLACRIGTKSRWAAGLLRDAGFARVSHLRGGLLAYAATHPDFAAF